MSSDPVVSVVMPVYNTADYVEEAVASIVSQSFRDWEFIIIDDGSTDGSGELLDNCAKLDHRIRVVHQENRGLSVTLNRGIDMARGRYVARMDGDDVSLPTRIEKQVEFMESHPEVGMCGTACRHFGRRGGRNVSGVSGTKTNPDEIAAQMLFWPGIVHPTVMMRRELIQAEGLYYDVDFRQAEDHELWLRFSQVSRVANLPEPLLLWRASDTQLTTASESEVTTWSVVVQSHAIAMLGLHPTDEETRIHLSLHKSQFEKSRDCVERVEAWLCKLLDANERTQVHEPKAFAKVIFERWCRVCASEYELGPWVFARLIRSRLFIGYHALSMFCLKFGARRLLKRQSLRQRRLVKSRCQES